MQNYTIGIDGGGSKTHALLVDKHKNIIDEISSGPANIRTDVNTAHNSILEVISILGQKHKLDLKHTHIGIGVAGYSVLVNRNKLVDLLRAEYPQITLASDCHIACLAAHSGHDGGVVICGTGIVGYYITNNIGYQIGGWGFPHGDLGGGAWIGLEICRYTCKAIDGVITWNPLLTSVFKQFENRAENFKSWLLKATPGDFAGIAKLLLQFNHDNYYYTKIMNDAITEVSRFIQAIIQKIGTLPIKITGGLAPIFLPKLERSFPQLSLSKDSPAFGACLLK